MHEKFDFVVFEILMLGGNVEKNFDIV